MRILHLALLLFGAGLALAGPSSGHRSTKRGSDNRKAESLCARMHNNTAFIGVEPFARLLVDSASKCQKSCMELHPKCTAVVFYYVFGEKVNHICFLFDRNSVNENVALVPEKPKNSKDVVRALEIVSNCHEFDPFPPLVDPFVVSSDKVGRDKRGVGFDKPIVGSGTWSLWSACNRANTQIRSQVCEYGRKIEKRQCASRYPQQVQPSYVEARPPPPTYAPTARYPPPPYNHPPSFSDEYNRRMEEHRKQELHLCCYKLQSSGNQVHQAIDKAHPCPVSCDNFQEIEGTTDEVTLPKSTYVPTIPTSAWAEWGLWSGCQVTCGYGEEIRERYCLSHQQGMCLGSNREMRECQRGQCPGIWKPWCEWTPCSASCGIGRRERSRFCEQGYQLCQGEDHQEETCNMGPCPEWQHWTEWSECTVSCGGGRSTRQRMCSGGNGCEGSSIEEMSCNEQPCPCWSEWSPYGECSVSCGTGTKTRSRYCENGPSCLGDALETIPCMNPPCAEWSMWTQWSQCSTTCGPGETSRTRECSHGNNCPGIPFESRPCNLGPCPTWQQWGEWTQCSVTCGEGTQSRTRLCNGYNCPGNSDETRPCHQQPCPTWGQWGPWGQCSVTCGAGTKKRERTCIGGYCIGERIQTEPCQLGPCPYWSEWCEWSQCRVTCGEGLQTRTRYCQYGTDCYGPAEESKPCQGPPCATWTQWGPWSECSAQCGPGQKTRERQCVTTWGTPSEDCQGPRSESIPCNGEQCCEWSDWCGWSVCDKDCNGGKKIRQRLCVRTLPGGELVTDPACGCPGPDKQIEDCNTQRCPPQCSWSEWCPWTQCPDKDPCKNATMTRTRECVGENGCSCYGFAEEKQFCRREAVCDPPIVPTQGIRRRRRME